MNIDLELRAALMAEIEKALPQLLKKAVAASKRLAPKEAPTTRKRLAKGKARGAIFFAIKLYSDEGASKNRIRQYVRQSFGEPLSEHTLKRCLLDLHKENLISSREGRWFAGSYETPPQKMPRDKERPELLEPTSE